ncbi:hypothetical protein METBIDRAFT_187358 [Metschnikowia bicuspidata var. bicuspidata NRRL YB-4993]|uniref:HMG box domain-containing protein n=1 Tax=Metschnikowia bicuspidata var. bicuspidata NRRL YB-4993 TaxID=869754 RepID=A0A1A0HC99_9ASCO|nr:hypothetical protein METBIDRAFT_187358 [Metschnikowia bicuspidata var. bicuspidata NRRL YB-4993]OBA21528.1 hypothetical protein METBIDRAFT_187358 [Metschnikowia bicuspidata var. bicuspidata NRRL YB-4993]
MSTPKSAAASEESYQNAKSSLVSSLVELSTAATQTATAALNFYKYAGTNGADAATASASLKTLSETVLAAANAASMTLANGSAPEPKRTIAKPQKKKEAAPAAAPASAPAPAPAPASVSAPSSASSDVTADTTMSDVLSTTDPALLKQGLEKPKKKRAEKDPNAPKKPVTSYLRFNLAERQRLKKERGESGQPTLQATELNQIIADRWATLDDVAKLELQRAYEADYEVYKKNVEDYKTKKLTELASLHPSRLHPSQLRKNQLHLSQLHKNQHPLNQRL